MKCSSPSPLVSSSLARASETSNSAESSLETLDVFWLEKGRLLFPNPIFLRRHLLCHPMSLSILTFFWRRITQHCPIWVRMVRWPYAWSEDDGMSGVHHHSFKAAFPGGTIPKCKIHSPPLDVKLVAEHPQVSFLWGGSSKYLQNVSLHFQGPPQKHLETCSLHFGYVPPLKRWWLEFHFLLRSYQEEMVLVCVGCFFFFAFKSGNSLNLGGL